MKIGHSEFGRTHGLFDDGWAPLWVVDFPMFEYDEEAQRWNAVHHPFTAPKDGHEDCMDTDPGRCVAKAYDMVLNGWELGGGSVRIHRAEVQSKVFRALKIGAEEAQLKFGFLLDALQYGAPPHGGLAFGLDRIVTLMTGAEIDPRRDRLPEDAARAGPADAGAEPGRREAAARAAHPAAQYGAAAVALSTPPGFRRRLQAAPVRARIRRIAPSSTRRRWPCTSPPPPACRPRGRRRFPSRCWS